MKLDSRRFLWGGLAGAVLLPVFLWFFVFTTPDSRFLAAKLSQWREQIESNAPQVESSLTIARAGGLPKMLENRSATLALQWPDRFFCEAEVDGRLYRLAREGGEILIQVPHQNLFIRGKNDIPRFSTRPDSIEPVALPPFQFPLSPNQLRLLPALVTVEKNRGEEGEILLQIQPKAFAAKRMGVPPGASLGLKLDASGYPRSVEIRDGKRIDALIQFAGWTFREGKLDSERWGDTGPVEAVALSHLTKFMAMTQKHFSDRAEPLPPFQGNRKLVARCGEGRLEDWDGARVLFLKGTPEEMGRQHGTLLTDEVRQVARRVLYGIGVASTFEKGRWFFREIEDAVARFQPFVDPRYLREMDALAAAAGLDPEEARLGNFFPELFHCSGFAISGAATADGTLYHGRILDYMRGAGLEKNAVVMVVQPDEGNAWVNVGYASFIGSVTAMNEKKISIGEMGGRGEGNWDGKPMAQLVREVMEKANTLEEAVGIMKKGPRTCEYYYVIADGKTGQSVGIVATPERFETVGPGQAHPQLPHPVTDAVLLSAGDRYEELVRRVKQDYGKFDAKAAIALMSRPVCATSNIQSVLFAPATLDFWVANADAENVASHARFTPYNLADLLQSEMTLTKQGTVSQRTLFTGEKEGDGN